MRDQPTFPVHQVDVLIGRERREPDGRPGEIDRGAKNADRCAVLAEDGHRDHGGRGVALNGALEGFGYVWLPLPRYTDEVVTLREVAPEERWIWRVEREQGAACVLDEDSQRFAVDPDDGTELGRENAETRRIAGRHRFLHEFALRDGDEIGLETADPVGDDLRPGLRSPGLLRLP